MKKHSRKGVVTFVSALLIFLLSGCTEETNFTGNSEVQARFRLNSNSSMKGKITIDRAYLKLDHVEVKGNYAGQNIANVTHIIPPEEPPYQLSAADSTDLKFTLPTLPYDQLDLNLFLYQDNYKLVFHAPVQEVPGPVEGNDGGVPSPDQGGGNAGGDNGPGNNGGSSGEDDEGGQESGSGDGDNGSDEDNGDGEEEGNNGDAGVNDDDDDEEGDDDDEDDEDDDQDDDNKKNKNSDKDKKNNDNGNEASDDDDDNDDDRLANNHTDQINLDHFFQNARPSLVVFATYNNNSQPLKLIFAVTGLETISVRATQNGNTDIVLSALNVADITFDPEHWFSSLSTSDIESGSVQSYQGQQVLFIHKDYNVHLYEALLSRLESSAAMNLSTPPTP